MRFVYLLLVIIAAVAFYFFAYPPLMARLYPPATPAAAASAPGAGGQGRRGAAPSAVIVAIAAKQTIPILKSGVGFMEAVDQAVVRARASGLITAVKVTEGQTVKAGDPLFQLDDAPIKVLIGKDEAAIARDQATADFQIADLARTQSLVDQGNDTTQQLQTAQSTTDAAKAAVAIDKAQLAADQLTLSYMTVVAPIGGRVGVLNASEGDTVSATDTSVGGLLTITEPAKLRASFSVPERELDDFRKALAGTSKPAVQIFVGGEQTPRATGTLSFIDSSIDTTSGSFLVKADVDNSAQTLWPGQYATVSVQVGAYTDATTVPAVAVQQSATGPFVFVVAASGAVKQQPITLIDTIDDVAVVGPEVSIGDQVVVEGQLGLVNGANVVATVQGQSPAGTGATKPARAPQPDAGTPPLAARAGN